MSINFAQVKALTIPEGSVKAIDINGVTVWSAVTRTYLINDTIDCSDLTKFPNYNTDGYKRPLWTLYNDVYWNNLEGAIYNAINNGKTVHCKLFKNNTLLIDWTNYYGTSNYLVFSDLSNPGSQSADRVYITHKIGSQTLNSNECTSTFYINGDEQFQYSLTSSDTITCQIYYEN